MYRVLTVAGSDSGGGAGIQADLKTFSAFGLFGMSAITAVTSQNTLGVSGFQALPPSFVGQQMEDVLSDIGADAVKTGMLATVEIIEEVAEKFKRFEIKNLVVDPVMVATSGDSLLEGKAEKAIINKLFPLAKVVTPNIPEAEVISGMAINSQDDMVKAAKIIYSFGPKAVIVKGGHLTGEALDILYDGKEIISYRTPRVKTRNTHGTGCTFSAAIAACLAIGMPVEKALRTAKDYIHLAIAKSVPLGSGHGPTNHLAGYFDHYTGNLKQSITQVSGRKAKGFENKKLYVITGEEFSKGRSVIEVVKQALEGGAGIIQLREKNWDTKKLVEVGRELKALTSKYNALLIVNDRLDVAMAVKADGVHLGQDDMPIKTARRILGQEMIIGVSIDTVEEARKAQEDGADYIGFGPVFPTSTKLDTGMVKGLELLSEVKKSVSIPIYAIGGIKLNNVSGIINAGADGAAVITAVISAENVKLAAESFINNMGGYNNDTNASS